MTELDPSFDPKLAQLISSYVDAMPGRRSPKSSTIRGTPKSREGVRIIVAIFGLAFVLAVSLIVVRERGQGPAGSPPASTCSAQAWPVTAISCDTAYRLGSQAGARVDRAKIWLTSLSDARQQFNWSRLVTEPAGGTGVWVVVFDGRWECCPNAYNADGTLIPQIVQTQWLVVVDATQVGAGFIFIGDWTDKAVPEALPPWSPG